MNETECLKGCLNHCSCQAYSYVDFGISSRRGETPGSATCWTWTEDVNNDQAGYFKSKLETYVDFPIDDLDLSTYISHKSSQLSNCYEFYAVSNHYGGMGGGHYTAFVDLGHKRWYEFDDATVYPVSEERIKTSTAYVLFYRRKSDV